MKVIFCLHGSIYYVTLSGIWFTHFLCYLDHTYLIFQVKNIIFYYIHLSETQTGMTIMTPEEFCLYFHKLGATRVLTSPACIKDGVLL